MTHPVDSSSVEKRPHFWQEIHKELQAVTAVKKHVHSNATQSSLSSASSSASSIGSNPLQPAKESRVPIASVKNILLESAATTTIHSPAATGLPQNLEAASDASSTASASSSNASQPLQPASVKNSLLESVAASTTSNQNKSTINTLTAATAVPKNPNAASDTSSSSEADFPAGPSKSAIQKKKKSNPATIPPKTAAVRLMNGTYKKPMGRPPLGHVWDGATGHWKRADSAPAAAPKIQKALPLRLADGTYKRPRGRKPFGCTWNPVTGKWQAGAPLQSAMPPTAACNSQAVWSNGWYARPTGPPQPGCIWDAEQGCWQRVVGSGSASAAASLVTAASTTTTMDPKAGKHNKANKPALKSLAEKETTAPPSPRKATHKQVKPKKLRPKRAPPLPRNPHAYDDDTVVTTAPKLPSLSPIRRPSPAADGTFARPRGRAKKGYEWDKYEGLWVPTTNPRKHYDGRDWEYPTVSEPETAARRSIMAASPPQAAVVAAAPPTTPVVPPRYIGCGACDACQTDWNCDVCLHCKLILDFTGDGAARPVCVERICRNPQANPAHPAVLQKAAKSASRTMSKSAARVTTKQQATRTTAAATSRGRKTKEPKKRPSLASRDSSLDSQDDASRVSNKQKSARMIKETTAALARPATSRGRKHQAPNKQRRSHAPSRDSSPDKDATTTLAMLAADSSSPSPSPKKKMKPLRLSLPNRKPTPFSLTKAPHPAKRKPESALRQSSLEKRPRTTAPVTVKSPTMTTTATTPLAKNSAKNSAKDDDDDDDLASLSSNSTDLSDVEIPVTTGADMARRLRQRQGILDEDDASSSTSSG